MAVLPGDRFTVQVCYQCHDIVVAIVSSDYVAEYLVSRCGLRGPVLCFAGDQRPCITMVLQAENHATNNDILHLITTFSESPGNITDTTPLPDLPNLTGFHQTL